MPFGQAAGDTCGRRALPGGDNDAHAIVAAASHGTATGVHHEADQEPAETRADLEEGEKMKTERNKDNNTDTSEEDDSHAVTTVHPNEERLKKRK